MFFLLNALFCIRPHPMDNDCNFIRGTCLEMCPEEELQMREKEKLLHLLEMVPGTERRKYPKADRNRAVKAFSRSAAGKEIRKSDLRPANVLLKTVGYLLFDVIDTEHLPWHLVYDFITDRLLAVRQDMVVQNLSIAESIALLQPIVRFHAYSAYRLCNESIQKFDRTLNNKHLQECLKKLLSFYEISDIKKQPCIESRSAFEAMYLIFNLGNEEALRHYLLLPEAYRNDLVKSCFVMSLAYQYRNYVRVCRIMKKLPPLLACLASLHLPDIRKTTLKMLSVAYKCGNGKYAIDKLRDLLLYSSSDELIWDCSSYGIKNDEHYLIFSNNSFDLNSKTVSPRYEVFVEQQFIGRSVQSLILNDDLEQG